MAAPATLGLPDDALVIITASTLSSIQDVQELHALFPHSAGQYRTQHYSSVRVSSRAYRPTEGGKRACNSCTSCIEEEMLAVTNLNQNLTCYDVDHALLHKVIIHTASLGASISPTMMYESSMPAPRLRLGFF